MSGLSRAATARVLLALLAALVVLLAVLLALAPSVARTAPTGKRIAAGFDLFETAPGTHVSLEGDAALPAGFFGPGSDPFSGQIALEGVPLGSFHGVPTGETDTIVHRLQPAVLTRPTGSATVPIELVQLSLHSIQPIQVTGAGESQRWDVKVDPSPAGSPRGTMTIRGRNPAGGRFDSVLPVVPRLTFTRIGDREQRVLDVGTLPSSNPLRSSVDLRAHAVPYTYDFASRLLEIPRLNHDFCAGCTQRAGRDFSESSRLARHKVHVPPVLVRIPAGFDLFQTDPDRTKFTLPGSFPIPAGFFGPGSDPFTGEIKFEGVPIGTFRGHDVGDADTVVRRKKDAVVGPGAGKDTIPIELVMLSLQSSEPIHVTVSGSTELWDVRATVSPTRHSSGSMTIRKRNESGGTFSSRFTVYPLLTFTNEATGDTRQLDLGAIHLPRTVASGIVFQAKGVPWQKGCREPALHVPGLNDDFCPSFTPRGKKKLTQEQAMLAAHGVRPAQPMYLPPLDCPPFDPPTLDLPTGGSGDTTCMLRRRELIHSFFDVLTELEPVAPAGLQVQLTAPRATLPRGESTPVNVHVTAAPDAAPGTYDVMLKVREAAGAAQATSVFDLSVTVESPVVTPPPLTGSGTFTRFMMDPQLVVFSIQFDGATTGFQIRLPTNHSIGMVEPPSGYTCQPQSMTSTVAELQCTNDSGSTPANTAIQGGMQVMPQAEQNMGADLFGRREGSTAFEHAGVISGPGA